MSAINERFSRRDQTLARLDEFRALKPGWDLGRGDAISTSAIDVAERVVLAAFEDEIWKSSVFPSPSGEVLLAFPLSEDLDIELYVRRDGLVDFICEKNGKIVEDVVALSEQDALARLRLCGRQKTRLI